MTFAGSTKLSYGSGPTNASLPSGNLRMCMADVLNPGIQYAIPKKASGSTHSWCRSIYLNSDTGPGTSITDVYLYSDGASSLGTGVTLYVGDQWPAAYIQSTGSYTNGTEMTALYTGTITTKSDMFTKTSASPLGPITQKITSGTGQITNWVVLQETVLDTATAGVRAAETLVWTYLVVE